MKTRYQMRADAKGAGWSVTDNGTEMVLTNCSPDGMEIVVSLETGYEGPEKLLELLDREIRNFDVSERAALWLDGSGHGRYGAPHDMADVYRDQEAVLGMMKDLLATWKEDYAFKVRVFFGEQLANAVGDGEMEEAEEHYANRDGIYVERSFGTESERAAYLAGIADMYGWNGFYVLDESEKKPDWAVDKSSE